MLRTELVAVVVLSLVGAASGDNVADITNPYTADANTVALFHVDENNGNTTTATDGFVSNFRNSMGLTKGLWVRGDRPLDNLAFDDNAWLRGANCLMMKSQTKFTATGNAWTVEAWIKPDAVTTTTGKHQILFGKYKNYSMLINRSTSVLTFTAYGSAGDTEYTSVSSASPLVAGEWQHVAGVFDGAEQKVHVYVNGVQAGSADTTFTTMGDHGDDPLLCGMYIRNVTGWNPEGTDFIGGEWINNYAYTGNWEEIRISDVARTPVSGPGPIRVWADDVSGDWSNGARWSPTAAPNANTHTAVFGDAITTAQVVYTLADVTAKTIEFDNANTYAIAGTGSVSLEADSGNAAIDVAQGDHQFQAAVNLNSSTDASVAASASLTFNNTLNLGGNTLTKTGDGTLSINNDLTTGGGSVVGLGGIITGGGTVGGNLTNTSATVAPGNSPGTLTVEGDFSQASGGTLAIELAGTASGEFDVLEVLGSATLGGSLDIAELYTPGGADAWTILTAVGGITGSFDTITAGYQVALANGDTELVLSLAGALLPGDANGDGCVDDLDLTALAVHWQQSTNLWEDGDFNGDGIVDDLDLTALAVNWQQGCGGGGSFADAVAAANVPEPASALILSVGFAGAVLRRRKE